MKSFVLFAVEGVSFVDVPVFSYIQDTFNISVISLTIQTNRSCAVIMATQIVCFCLDHQYIAYFIKPITLQTMDINS